MLGRCRGIVSPQAEEADTSVVAPLEAGQFSANPTVHAGL